MDHDPQGFQVDVLDPQQPDLARPQPMPVGDEEERPVTAVRADRPEQAGSLVEGQEADGLGWQAAHSAKLARRGTARNNRSGQFCRLSTGRSRAKTARLRPRKMHCNGQFSQDGRIYNRSAASRPKWRLVTRLLGMGPLGDRG
jgi:hypothetical protein